MTVRRQSLTPEAAGGLGVAIAVVIVVTGIELAEGPGISVVGWLAIAPFIAATFAPWRPVVAVGALVSLLTFILGLFVPTGFDTMALTRLVGIVMATGGAVAVSVIRQRQNVRYAELARLATVAQEAVLRRGPPGHRGPVRVGQRRRRHRR
jgi:phosphoserine phosphatase RsbU/P